jgi:hypothetical protein
MRPQEISFAEWSRGQSLRAVIQLPRSPISSSGDRQLDYIARYIEKPELHAAAERSVLIEPHYIDRDFLEDCGAFYVLNLEPPPNHCERVHFFACTAKELERRVDEARESLRKKERGDYDRLCHKLSQEFYLGFTVIRPLPGCPIGRTVLRCLRAESDGATFRRQMTVTRDYHAHVAGVDLSVCGLAFQQQDRAVSACATVAIWCAFHRLREIDDSICPSPSRITKLATQYALPFGRSMPAGEGLNISQMCTAIERLQMSPALTAFVGSDFDACRQAIWSAVHSGYPAVLILERLGVVDERLPPTRRLQKPVVSGHHAVTVMGVKQSASRVTAAKPFDIVDSAATSVELHRAGQDVQALYLHDDRIGPYRRADFVEPQQIPTIAPLDVEYLSKRPIIKIRQFSHTSIPTFEYWGIRYLVLPLHPRVRVGTADLDRFALGLCKNAIVPLIAALKESDIVRPAELSPSVLRLDYWIERGHKYEERVLTEQLFRRDVGITLSKRVGFPRHVGVLRFEIAGGAGGVIDVLLDTTSSVPNERFLMVLSSDATPARMIAGDVAEVLGKCEVLN